MNRIEKAYSLGYRATIDGKLYLNDKELPLYIRRKIQEEIYYTFGFQE